MIASARWMIGRVVALLEADVAGFGRAVPLRKAEVVDGLVGVAAGGQHCDRDENAFLGRQLGSFPDLPEQHVVGEPNQRRSEVAEPQLPRSLVSQMIRSWSMLTRMPLLSGLWPRHAPLPSGI